MERVYHVIYEKSTHKDLKKIRKYAISKKYYERIMQEISRSIENLKYMPRIHKTLICIKDTNGEYRRMLSGKYSIIYKIIKDEIIILRIFNQKENYLNQRKFILREDNQKYFISERKIEMMKLRTLKNSYAKIKENFIHTITEEEALNRYLSQLIDEAEEDLKNGGKIITLAEWREELMKEYNVAL